MTKSSNLLTTAQVAKALGKSVRTIHRMADSGQLRAVAKLPGETGAYLFHRADVEALAATK